MFFRKRLAAFVFACAFSKLAPLAQAQSLTSLFVAGGDHAYYVSTNQHVCQSYKTSSGWVSQDLTVASGTSTLAAPNTMLASLPFQNRDYVYYFDASGHVNQLYYSGSGSTWVNQDLTAISQAPTGATPGSALATFLYNNVGQVFYFDNNRHVNHLWASGLGWANEDLTASTHAPAPAAVGSGLNSYSEASGQLDLYYIDTNQHVSHMWWNGQAWLNEDLMALSRTSARAALGSTLTGFSETNGKVHVFHFDAQPHVGHLWWNTQTWFSEDVTALSKTNAVPSPASGLSSLAGPNGAAYVYYADTRQHVNQLGWNGQAWSNQDLADASAFRVSANTYIYDFAAPQTALTSLLITGGNHVYYVDTQGHVNQIYWDGQKWVNQDITAYGQGPTVSGGIENGAASPFSREYIYGNGQVIALENGQH